MRTLSIVAILAIIATAGGYAAYRFWAGQPAGIAGKPLPHIAGLSDLDGIAHDFPEWQGKLLMVNFWATWCGPCLQEIPELAKAQEKYGSRGLQLVGPAVDDPEAVRSLLPSLKINYPVLVTNSSDAMIKGMEVLENTVGGLPFSVLVGPDGKIIETHLGPLSAQELVSFIEPHLPPKPSS